MHTPYYLKDGVGVSSNTSPDSNKMKDDGDEGVSQHHHIEQKENKYDRNVKVFVNKIPDSVENEFVEDLLRMCGSVKEWTRVPDPTGNHEFKSFGICEFNNVSSALRAVRVLGKLNIDDGQLELKINKKDIVDLQQFKELSLYHFVRKETRKEKSQNNKKTNAKVVLTERELLEQDESFDPTGTPSKNRVEEKERIKRFLTFIPVEHLQKYFTIQEKLDDQKRKAVKSVMAKRYVQKHTKSGMRKSLVESVNVTLEQLGESHMDKDKKREYVQNISEQIKLFRSADKSKISKLAEQDKRRKALRERERRQVFSESEYSWRERQRKIAHNEKRVKNRLNLLENRLAAREERRLQAIGQNLTEKQLLFKTIYDEKEYYYSTFKTGLEKVDFQLDESVEEESKIKESLFSGEEEDSDTMEDEVNEAVIPENKEEVFNYTIHWSMISPVIEKLRPFISKLMNDIFDFEDGEMIDLLITLIRNQESPMEIIEAFSDVLGAEQTLKFVSGIWQKIVEEDKKLVKTRNDESPKV